MGAGLDAEIVFLMSTAGNRTNSTMAEDAQSKNGFLRQERWQSYRLCREIGQ